MKAPDPARLVFEDLILHDDPRFVIVSKPPFLATLEDRASTHNLLKMAREVHPEARVCHRLDKETSGVLVIAKELTFYKYFSALLESREVSKMYHAVVEGVHHLEEEEVNAPIRVTSNKSHLDRRQGKPSVTLVSTLDTFKYHTLLACMPFTGRTHQIRVHLAGLGMPIAGDHMDAGSDPLLSNIKRRYNKPKGKEEQPLIHRFALHAAAISFPLEGEGPLKVTAPYPKDFQILLSQLEKNKR